LRHFFNRFRSQRRIDNFKYIERKKADGSRFICTTTIVDRINESRHRESQPLFATKYNRKAKPFFCKNYEGLFTFQFSEFLKTKNLKFSFIIFNNCNIQLYDNGYLFAPVTEFIAGSQSLNDFTFWDFPIICKTITGNIDVSSEKMNEQIFESCEKEFFLNSTDQTLHYFLIKTADFKNLHNHFSIIVEAIEKKVKADLDYREQIVTWLSSAAVTSDFLELPFFDILIFFNIANEKGNNMFEADLNQFRLILETRIIHKKSSQGKDHCGFSLYFPRSKQEFNDLKGELCNYFHPSVMNEFTQNSRYDELLLALYE
jgi:hypothetical protein